MNHVTIAPGAGLPNASATTTRIGTGVTGADGLASVERTLGGLAGEQTTTATVEDLQTEQETFAALVGLELRPRRLRSSPALRQLVRETTLRVDDLIRFGTLSVHAARFLQACVVGKLNVVVSGGTGTGKSNSSMSRSMVAIA